MKSTTLFSIYATTILALMIALGGSALYSLNKANNWDERIQLAQKSHRLHLQLEVNVFRLLKQHADALLIGDRDRGAGERNLREKIDHNIADIRQTIAQEIMLVGEEEFEELELLEEIEADIREVNRALQVFTTSGKMIETDTQINRLADLLDREIDIHLSQLIERALQEETEEVEETILGAAEFRARNTALVYALFFLTALALMLGFLSFNRQIHSPLNRLDRSLRKLRNNQYSTAIELGGCREFKELGIVMGEMAANLVYLEKSHEEKNRSLESTVHKRTVELQQMIDRLELGEQNRKRLMADISHELRTPLAIILGEAEVALRSDDSLSDATSDTLALIRDSAAHTNKIVDDMLTVARQEAGQLRLDRRDTDLRAVIQEAARMFPQEVALNLPPEPARLSVDLVRIRQCMLALFQNARRYGGPTIQVTLESTTNGIRFIVEDDGNGLSADEQTHAFDRFFRGSNASTLGIEGSGLGLPVVKSIVEAHGGSIMLGDSELGGLRVQVDLPRPSAVRIVDSDFTKQRA